MERVLDLRGLRCPLPALKTTRALRRSAPGEVVTVLTDDPLAFVDIPNVVRETGDLLVEPQRQDSTGRFVIRRGGASGAA